MLGWMDVDNPSTTTPWLKCSSAQCLKIVNLSWNMLNFAKLTGNGAVMTAAVAASGVAPAAVSAASAPSAASTGPAVPAAPAAYVPLQKKKKKRDNFSSGSWGWSGRGVGWYESFE